MDLRKKNQTNDYTMWLEQKRQAREKSEREKTL